MKEKLNKLLTVVVIVLAVLCIVLGIKAIMGKDVTIFGFRFYHILTGSMEPTIPEGSIILTKEVDPDKLEVKDVISFISRDDAIYGNVNTHRITAIEETEEGRIFVTKGDANGTIDSVRVRPEDIKGKVIFHCNFKGLSMFMKFLRTGYGFITCIALPLLFVFMQVLKSFKSQVDELLEDSREYENSKKDEGNKESGKQNTGSDGEDRADKSDGTDS